MENTKIERDVEQWFENYKLGKPDVERERINESICTDKHRMVENRYMPFFGNPKAKVVYCNLNPGSANLTGSLEGSHHSQFIKKHEECLNSDSADDLKGFLRDFASHKFNMNFDRKQLLYLYGFCEVAKKNGVDVGMEFHGGNNLDKKEELKKVVCCKDNQRNLFNNRFQLELIPYASNQFDASQISPVILSEYFMKLLDEVFSLPRSFVFLSGNVYANLLKNTKCAEKIILGDYKKCFTNQHGVEQYVRVIFFKLTRNGQSRIFIVVPTFQGRVNQAYINMYLYGKFCADKYFEILNSSL